MRDCREEIRRGPEGMHGEWSRLRLFFRVFMFWALASGVAFLCSYVQFEDVTETDKAKVGSFLNGTLYRFNTVNYIIGAAFFLLLFLVLWHFMMRRPLRHIRRSTAFCKLACAFLTLAGVLGILYAAVMSDMRAVGLFNGMESGWMEAATVFGWPLFALLYTIVSLVKAWRMSGKPPMPPRP